MKKILCMGCMREYEGDFDICPYCGYKQDTPPKEVYHIVPGTMLREQYIVGRVLGFGGFGTTYIGFDTHLEKRVAIKEYFPSEFATRMPNETEVRVFAGEKKNQFLKGMQKSLEEAQRLAKFTQTQGIAQIYDFFGENNTAYIVMELLEGETLKERLKRVGKMPVDEALPIVLAVLAALKAAHAQNVIHRDISPDNIYLLNTGEVKLIDFGAARQVTTTHSKSLTVLLKQGYAPVEQYQSDGDQGPWTDVYALAATFYRMITGKKPPEAPDRRVEDTLKEPSKLGVAIPKNIENALMNALQVRVEDRIRSAEEFEQELCAETVQRRQATKDKEDVGRWPLWTKVLCIAAGAAVIGAGALLATGVIDSPLPVLPAFEKQEDTVWMPSLVNLWQDDAKEKLESEGLRFEIAGTKPSDTIMEGYVLSQEDADGNVIPAGTEVASGSLVRVTISSGSGKTQVPDILWMSEETGTKLLKDEGLVAVNVETDTDSDETAGIITGITPEIGAEAKLEDVITIRVAAGQKNGTQESGTAEVPSVVSKDQSEAKTLLSQSGLHLEKTALEYSTEVPQGQVISQQPEAGTAADKGTAVQVVVSKGPKQIYVYSVVGYNVDDATAKLTDSGFTVNCDYVYNADTAENVVFAQSLTEGVVDEGTEIVLTVSQGPEPVKKAAEKTNTKKTAADRSNQPAQQAQTPQTQAQPQQTQAQAQAQTSQTQAQTQTAPKQTISSKQSETPQTQAQAQTSTTDRDPAFDRLQ